jgi:hypothetical protein
MKNYQCTFTFVNISNGVKHQIYFVHPSSDVFSAQRESIIKACTEIINLDNYALQYWKVDEHKPVTTGTGV